MIEIFLREVLNDDKSIPKFSRAFLDEIFQYRKVFIFVDCRFVLKIFSFFVYSNPQLISEFSEKYARSTLGFIILSKYGDYP